MNNNSQASSTATALRRDAQTRLRARAGKTSSGSEVERLTADPRRLLHELQVHQIELEMQNEELRTARDEMEAGLEKYSELYDFAPVGYLTLDREGTVREANLTAASLLGIPRAPLMKRQLRGFVAPAERPDFDAFLRQVFDGGDAKECDVKLLLPDKPPVEVRMRANLSGGEQVCLMAVSDITQQKLAEAATAQLAAIVTSSSDAIIGKNLNSIVTSWNSGAEKLFGYSAGEMVGRSILTLIPPDLQDEEAQMMGRVRKGTSVVHFVTARVAKDGRRFDMSITISPVRLPTGKIVGASTVARDITEHKRVEDSVRVSEIRYRRLFETAHDGLLLLDPATRQITDANPLMTKLLGYSREQLVGKELFEIGLLKDETASQVMFQKLTRKREVRYEDLPLKSKDGRDQEVEVVANLYEENGHRVIQCNIRDITARKAAERALVASEERYRTLFTSIDEGYCVIEMIFDQRRKPVDYRFLEVNPVFRKQTGLANPIGKRMRELVPEIENHWIECYGNVVLTGKAVRFMNEAKAMGGRWFDVYACPVGGPSSRNVAIIFNDITARRKSDESLRSAQKQLATHAAQLESMVATRTAQLTATNRRLEASIATIRKAQDEYRKLFLDAQIVGKKLRQMTRQILTAQEEERKKISRELHDDVVQTLVGINVELSALVHGNSDGVKPLKDKIARTQRLVENAVDSVHRFARDLRPSVLDDLGLIPALHVFCRQLAERKKIKIKITAFGGIEALDPDKRTVLYRVAQEALNNVARHARASHAEIHLSKIAEGFRMEIRDNGQSFAVEKVLQAKNPKRLGLVGMKERIEMVGGNLKIESVSGKGTTVRVEIPFSPFPPPPPSSGRKIIK